MAKCQIEKYCIRWKHVTRISLSNRLLAIVTTNLGIGQDRKLSVLSNELKVFCLDQCPDWWLQWLTVDLIMKFWSRVSILCSIFLFGILPCSFLLIEADGFSFGPRHGLRARLYETFVIFSLLFLLILFFFCLILVVSGSFDVSDGLSVIPRLASEVTPMLRTLLSFIGTFVCWNLSRN
jgi:hypothetical protein